MISLFFSLALAQEIRVMVVDTGVSREVKEIKPFLSDKNDILDLVDDHGHGTHVAGLILYGAKLKDKVCDRVKIYSCKGLDSKSNITSTQCFRKADELNIKILNFSGGGKEYLNDEAGALRNLIGKTKVVVAAGNDNTDLRVGKYYPASLRLPNMEIVGNGLSEPLKHHTSNYGLADIVWRLAVKVKSFSAFRNVEDRTTRYEWMTGTSQSAAIRTHELVQEECKK
jgi:major intracellular serine protease